MKSVRLLPVVILAAAALLLLKGLGLVTNGGYVLSGAASVEAASEQHEGGADGEATLAVPVELTAADTSPTLTDEAPTLPLRDKDAEHQQEVAAGAEGEHGAGDEGAAEAAGDAESAAVACPPEEKRAAAGHEAKDTGSEATAEDCADAGVNAAGDSLPTMRDGDGKIVPLTAEDEGSQEAVVERLGARREALDDREAELEMRLALVEAAERRIAERTAALEELEARINALVEAKKAADDSQFKAMVSMYETMKPKEAAAIFDQLELPVLLRVASAMTPRKMSQIMAKMTPGKAKELTAGMAVEQTEPNVDLADGNLAALPQIVGQ